MSLAGVRLEAKDVPREHRFAAFQEATRPVFDSAPLCAERAFPFSAAAYRLDDVLPLRMSYGRHVRIRGPRQARRDATDQIAVRFHLRGRNLMSVGDHPIVIGPELVYLYDVRHEMRCEVSAGETIGAVLPYRRIDLRPFHHTPVIAWPIASPKGRLLVNAVMTLWSELPTLSGEDAADVAAGLAGLINGLIGSHRTAEQAAVVERATLAAMLAHIDRHLDDLTLDVPTLCRRFQCSRSRLYALFRPLGGVERYIRERRLQRCFNELLTMAPRRGRVTALVERWGFEDHSHLHRAFKARFGIAPSEIAGAGVAVAAAATGERPDADVGKLQHWLGRF